MMLDFFIVAVASDLLLRFLAQFVDFETPVKAAASYTWSLVTGMAKSFASGWTCGRDEAEFEAGYVVGCA